MFVRQTGAEKYYFQILFIFHWNLRLVEYLAIWQWIVRIYWCEQTFRKRKSRINFEERSIYCNWDLKSSKTLKLKQLVFALIECFPVAILTNVQKKHWTNSMVFQHFKRIHSRSIPPLFVMRSIADQNEIDSFQSHRFLKTIVISFQPYSGS